jgi:hypothetical protein
MRLATNLAVPMRIGLSRRFPKLAVCDARLLYLNTLHHEPAYPAARSGRRLEQS